MSARFFCLAHDFPIPVDDGSKHRILWMLRSLASWGETKVAVSPRGDTGRTEVDELVRQTGADVLVGHRLTFPPVPRARLWASSMARRTPPWFVQAYDPGMAELARAHAGWATHLVVLDDFAAQYLPAIGDVAIPRILDKHQVYAATGALGERRRGRFHRVRDGMLRRLVRINEARTLEFADRVIVTTPEEAERLERIHGRRPDAVVHTGVDQQLVWRADAADAGRVLWLGSIDSGPNREGLEALVEHLRTRFGTTWPFTLDVVGRGVDERLRHLCADLPVELHGFVERVDDVLVRCGAAIIPLQGGGGGRVKTVQLLGTGIPVVTTPTALEGVDARDGDHCVVAPDLAHLVEGLLRVLADRDAAASMGRRAHELVRDHHSWAAQTSALRSVVGLP